jgi:hypothetical protein
VGGFGAGALVIAPVATRLIQSVGVLPTFAYLGIAYLIVTVAAGLFMRNPPEGWRALQVGRRALQMPRSVRPTSTPWARRSELGNGGRCG